jgi:hypothetical protein
MKKKREDLAYLEDIPNVGPAIAADLRQLRAGPGVAEDEATAPGSKSLARRRISALSIRGGRRAGHRARGTECQVGLMDQGDRLERLPGGSCPIRCKSAHFVRQICAARRRPAAAAGWPRADRRAGGRSRAG